LARTLAASEQPRIAFGKRAGQKVCRLGSGFGFEGESPTLSGTRVASAQAFPACQPSYCRPPPRPVGAAHPLRRPGCGVPGAPGTRRQRGDLLHLHSGLLRWHDGDPTVAVRAVGEVGGVDPAAAGTSGPVWGWFGRPPPAAGRHPANASPTRQRGGRQPRRVALGLGPAPPPRLHRPATLPPCLRRCSGVGLRGRGGLM